MMTSVKLAHDSHHVALDPVMLRDQYDVTYKSEIKGHAMSLEDAAFLKSRGWERRGMHTSKLTDWWAHPTHSPKLTVSEEDVKVWSPFGEPSWVVQKIERTRWKWFTREQALTLEGKFQKNVVPHF